MENINKRYYYILRRGNITAVFFLHKTIKYLKKVDGFEETGF